MALMKCPECGGQASSTAFKCPHCGYTIRTPKRGFFGTIFKWVFIAWNVLMLVWLIGGMHAASKVHATDQAENAGKAIGTALGAGIIVTIWVFGSIILGLFVLFTRPKS